MGFLNRHPRVEPADITALRVDLNELRQRLALSEQGRARLETQLLELADKAQTITNQSEDLQAVNYSIAALTSRINAAVEETRKANENTMVVNQRVNNVATELTNQINELGGELDTLYANRPDPPQLPPPVVEPVQTMPTEVLDAIRNAQVKLATEQARYEIAFREELAALAEQLRRNR